MRLINGITKIHDKSETLFQWVGMVRAAHLLSIFLVSVTGPALDAIVHDADAADRVHEVTHLPNEPHRTFDNVIDCIEAFIESMA